MDIESLRSYCLAKKGTSEDMPFGETVLVCRVMKKIFALIPIDEIPPRVNLKCDPDLAVELRERYAAVTPAYHQNKKHWNTVEIDGTIPIAEIREMIDHSYELVAKSLKKSEREELAAL